MDEDALARAAMVKVCAALLRLLRNQTQPQRDLDALTRAWWDGYKYGQGARDDEPAQDGA